MIKLIQVKETVEDTKITEDMYCIEALIHSIIQQIEFNKELNYDDFKFTQAVFKKVKSALKKVNEVIKI